jgi:hypothetical protein
MQIAIAAPEAVARLSPRWRADHREHRRARRHEADLHFIEAHCARERRHERVDHRLPHSIVAMLEIDAEPVLVRRERRARDAELDAGLHIGFDIDGQNRDRAIRRGEDTLRRPQPRHFHCAAVEKHLGIEPQRIGAEQ